MTDPPVNDREKGAREMDALYRLLKTAPSASLASLAQASGLHENLVRYYVDFFIWYGVAVDPEAPTERSCRSGRVATTQACRERVEGRTNSLEFFRDAYIELPVMDLEERSSD